MEKQLTIEQLKWYLGTGIKIEGTLTGNIYDLKSLSDSGRCEIYHQLNDEKGWSDLPHLSPILNPLSMITEEIEHNGERFIPLGKLHYLYCLTPTGRRSKRQYEVITEIGYTGTVAANAQFIDGVMIYHDMNRTDFRIVKKLISWHFDIFGLIDEGLAIDKRNGHR